MSARSERALSVIATIVVLVAVAIAAALVAL
jgi:hypothetical protein